jgi:hypothetical protein
MTGVTMQLSQVALADHAIPIEICEAGRDRQGKHLDHLLY